MTELEKRIRHALDHTSVDALVTKRHVDHLVADILTALREPPEVHVIARQVEVDASTCATYPELIAKYIEGTQAMLASDIAARGAEAAGATKVMVVVENVVWFPEDLEEEVDE